MARKTKYAMKSKSKSHRRKYRKTRKYRGRGGCNSNTCVSSSAPVWTSKGGACPEQINKDIYNNVIDPSFYSSV